MQLGQKISEGACHQIFENFDNPDELIKLPKNNHFSYEVITKDIALCRERFSEWLPNTEVEASDEFGYLIKQSRVQNIEHITPDHLKCEIIRRQVAAIFEANRQSLERDGIGIDFIGLEGSTKCVLAHAKQYKGTMVDTLVITPIMKFFLWLKSIKKTLPVPSDTLELWNRADIEPEISNIVLGNGEKSDKQVYLIDLSLVHTKSTSLRERMRTIVLQKWNTFFLRKQFDIEL